MFLIFGGENYYPGGGGADLMAIVETTLQDAARVAEKMIAEEGYCPEWLHILDTETKKVHALGALGIAAEANPWSKWGGSQTASEGQPVPTVALTAHEIEIVGSDSPLGPMTHVTLKKD